MHLDTAVDRLRSIRWTWKRLEAEDALSELAGTPVERVEGRTSFGMENGIDVSLYYENEQVEYVEMTLEASPDPHLLSPQEYEARIDEFLQKYREGVAVARKVLGPPVFDGPVSADEFPDDQDALWLALWPIPNGRLMIEQKHEDKELPIRLCVVVAPAA